MTINPLKFLKRYPNIHCILLGRDGKPSRAFDRSNLANTFSRPTSYILVLMAMAMSAAISWAVAASIYGGY